MARECDLNEVQELLRCIELYAPQFGYRCSFLETERLLDWVVLSPEATEEIISKVCDYFVMLDFSDFGADTGFHLLRFIDAFSSNDPSVISRISGMFQNHCKENLDRAVVVTDLFNYIQVALCCMKYNGVQECQWFASDCLATVTREFMKLSSIDEPSLSTINWIQTIVPFWGELSVKYADASISTMPLTFIIEHVLQPWRHSSTGLMLLALTFHRIPLRCICEDSLEEEPLLDGERIVIAQRGRSWQYCRDILRKEGIQKLLPENTYWNNSHTAPNIVVLMMMCDSHCICSENPSLALCLEEVRDAYWCLSDIEKLGMLERLVKAVKYAALAVDKREDALFNELYLYEVNLTCAKSEAEDEEEDAFIEEEIQNDWFVQLSTDFWDAVIARHSALMLETQGYNWPQSTWEKRRALFKNPYLGYVEHVLSKAFADEVVSIWKLNDPKIRQKYLATLSSLNDERCMWELIQHLSAYWCSESAEKACAMREISLIWRSKGGRSHPNPAYPFPHRRTEEYSSPFMARAFESAASVGYADPDRSGGEWSGESDTDWSDGGDTEWDDVFDEAVGRIFGSRANWKTDCGEKPASQSSHLGWPTSLAVTKNEICSKPQATEKPRLHRSCSACGKADASMLCTGCRVAIYCSKDCQAKHWKTHRNACGMSNGTAKAPSIGQSASSAPAFQEVEGSYFHKVKNNLLQSVPKNKIDELAAKESIPATTCKKCGLPRSGACGFVITPKRRYSDFWGDNDDDDMDGMMVPAYDRGMPLEWNRWLEEYIEWDCEMKSREWVIYNGFVGDLDLCAECELLSVRVCNKKYTDTNCLHDYLHH